MKGRLILTGVTGAKSGGVFVEYISRNIGAVNELFSGGISIICRGSSDTKKVEMLLPSAKIICCNFSEVDSLTAAMKGADTVFHVAGIPLSREVADAAAKAEVRRLIVVHTTGIYSKYKSVGAEYREIDKYVENVCRNSKIHLTVLRPTMIYGNIKDRNVSTFVKMVDKLPIMPVVRDARFELQPVNYKDLGKAYFNVLMNEEKTMDKNYNLSGGEVIQLREMLTIIGEHLGKKVVFIHCPYWVAYSGAWVLYALTFGRKDYREKVQRLCEVRVFDHSKATQDFGYQPMLFKEGIIDEVNDYIQNKNATGRKRIEDMDHK